SEDETGESQCGRREESWENRGQFVAPDYPHDSGDSGARDPWGLILKNGNAMTVDGRAGSSQQPVSADSFRAFQQGFPEQPCQRASTSIWSPTPPARR